MDDSARLQNHTPNAHKDSPEIPTNSVPAETHTIKHNIRRKTSTSLSWYVFISLVWLQSELVCSCYVLVQLICSPCVWAVTSGRWCYLICASSLFMRVFSQSWGYKISNAFEIDGSSKINLLTPRTQGLFGQIIACDNLHIQVPRINLKVKSGTELGT